MYDRLYGVFLAAGIVLAVFSIWCACRYWRTKPDSRTISVLAAVLVCLLVVLHIVQRPSTLRVWELSHYDALFQAEQVEYNGADVTDIFSAHRHECWAFDDMQPCDLPKNAGEAVGTLRFFDEPQREFADIQLIRLTQPVDNPRVYQNGGAYYAFCSADWKSKGYVYGFSDQLARQLLAALPG